MVNAALVLEGGALRSLYTAGVLDYFVEKNIEFSAVIGVSAGALTAANYISKQRRRIAQINILHSCDSNYYGLKQLLLKKSVFNFDYLFDDLDRQFPYDMEAFTNSRQKFFIAATDCKAGEVQYFESADEYIKLTQQLRASSSLPLLAPMIHIEEKTYLDGGITAPIGIQKALDEQYGKVVVILTREKEFVKESENLLIRMLFRIYYRKYPALLKALQDMPDRYNEIRHMIDELEMRNEIFVIRPQRLQKIGYAEKNARKLIQLYFQGLQDAQDQFEAMKKYLCI